MARISTENGTFQFCVDYRKHNAANKRNCSPILRMNECIDSPGKATAFRPFKKPIIGF